MSGTGDRRRKFCTLYLGLEALGFREFYKVVRLDYCPIVRVLFEKAGIWVTCCFSSVDEDNSASK
jgi:hypothetical protein